MGNWIPREEASKELKKEALRKKGIQPLLGPGEGGSGVTDHGGLTGLGDDDHTQYLNQTRGDARYSQLGHTHQQYGCIGASFDGGGSDIAVNTQTDLYIPYDFTISQVSILADAAGSIVIDIWKDSYGNFPPTSADKITASAPPALSSAAKMLDSTLTGWTKSVAAGSTLRFNINSCSGIKRATLLIEGVRG